MHSNFKRLNNWHIALILLAHFLFLGVIISKDNSLQIKAETASVLSFPGDHGQHIDFVSEWWYLNLLTKTTKTDGSDEKNFGYVVSFSRIAGSKGLLSSSYDDKTKSFKESTNTGGALSVSLTDGQYLFAQYTNGAIMATLEEKPAGSDRKKVYRLTGKTAEIGSFDLTLKERTVVSSGHNSPLLWGGTTGNCRGQISVFKEDDTFYYSIPDLDITGTITDTEGVIRNVTIGKAWIDHQWLNSTPPSDWKGHYWTSFHFTHSNNLYDTNPHQAVGFVTQIYSDGPRYTYWVKRNADGTNECGVGGKVTVNSYGLMNYPSSWKVELNKSSNLFLQANGAPFSDNQIFKPPSGRQFFEPASFYYSGSVDGKAFIGLGFFETHLNKYQAILQFSVLTPTPSLTPESVLACMRAAVEKRDNAIIAAWDNLTVAPTSTFATTSIKSALETRKAEVLAAWTIADRLQRREVIKAAWTKFRTARIAARNEFRNARKTTWNTFKAEGKTCTGANITSEFIGQEVKF